PTYAGIFVLNTVTGDISKIVSSADSLTGLNTLLPEFTYSVNSLGQLVFKATDGVNAGYYLANVVGGVSNVSQIVLSGQTINVAGHDVTLLLSDIVNLGKYQLSNLNFVFEIISDSEEIVLGNLQTLLATPTPTPTNTPTPTATATGSATGSATSTATATPTATSSASNTATSTPTRTATASMTPTQTATPTPSSTSTSTSTASSTATRTATPTPTATGAPTSTASSTVTATATPTATSTAKATPTSTATPTPEPTDVPVKLLVRPRKVNFGDQQMTTVSSSRIITVTNRSKKKRAIAVTMEGISGQGPFVITTDHCTGTVLPFRGSTCQVTVAFQPNALGKMNGTLTITDNARKDPQKVKLRGFGMNQ
ncbi:MAG TPA: choice-of-anchor D domain-containing protein, partial [Candidatus Binatus sp.]|nr:choice-of-anchor D domain-containing protein [Candidatus Binatus sp.]